MEIKSLIPNSAGFEPRDIFIKLYRIIFYGSVNRCSQILII